jgi:hypothetical protein
MILGCAGAHSSAGVSPETKESVQPTPKPSSHAGSRQGAAPPESDSPEFPTSTLAPVARELGAVAQAALEGKPWPQTAWAPEPKAPQARWVAVRQGTEPPAGWRPSALLLRLSTTLAPAKPDAGARQRLHIRLGFLVDGRGTGLLQLESRSRSSLAEVDPDALPEPFAKAVREVMAAVAKGRVRSMTRPPPGPAAFPRGTRLIRDEVVAEGLSAGGLQLQSLGVEDVALLGRQKGGRWWLGHMRVETGETGPRLKTPPVVKMIPL